MTVFSKIFIVINLGLTLLLTGVMATLLGQRNDHRNNYKAAIDATVAAKKSLATEKAEAKTRNKALLEARDKKAADVDDQRKARDELNGRHQTISGAIAQRRKDADVLSTEIKALGKSKDSVQDAVTILDNRSRKARLDRDLAVKARDVASGSLNDYKLRIQKVEERIADLQLRIKTRDMRDQEIEALYKIYQKQDPPIPVAKVAKDLRRIGQQIEARITNMGDFMVGTINIGKTSKIVEDMEFIVSRGGKYIGKVRVEALFDREAKVRGLPETMAEGQRPQVGDVIKRY